MSKMETQEEFEDIRIRISKKNRQHNGSYFPSRHTTRVPHITYEEFEDTKKGKQNPYIEEKQTTQWELFPFKTHNKGHPYQIRRV
jgi:hypothetical protein